MAIGCEAVSGVRLAPGQEDAMTKDESAKNASAEDDLPSGKPETGLKLTLEAASRFARLAADCIQREYPNKPGHVMNSQPWK